MKLSKGVMEAVRGIGVATLIVSSGVGCAAPSAPRAERPVSAEVSPPAKPSTIEDGAEHDVAEGDVSSSEPVGDPGWDYDEVAAACGRG